MLVHIYTWNAGEALEKADALNMSGWLNSVRTDSDTTAPDLYVIGLQEAISLPWALAGYTSTYLPKVEDTVREAIQRKAEEAGSAHKYKLLETITMGAQALLLFGRENGQLLIGEVSTAFVGCGPLFMSNKGAVGARLSFKESSQSLTFVSAHLAPHEYNLQSRNIAWQSIVERLVFYSRSGVERHQIYDTDHLFVLGDLNYRLSVTAPKKLDSSTLDSLLEKQAYDKALEHDQLRHEIAAGRTMHRLTEAQIDFPPTYKYKKGTDRLVAFSKRVPSWCDRILHTHNSNLRVLKYTSIQQPNPSDHKPVVAVCEIAGDSRSVARDQAERTSPFPIDNGAGIRSLIGWVMDRLVGYTWCSVAKLGFGNDKLGAFVILFAIFALMFKRLDFAGALDNVERLYKHLD